MSVDTSVPTSRRGYLSQDELEQYANITITDTTEADDRISQAEELIDAYVGPQDSFFEQVLQGVATAGSETSIKLQSKHQNVYEKDYFVGMQVEIIGGTGRGEIERVTASTKAGVLTTTSWDTTPDTTSVYRIKQLGKFPRRKDVFYETEAGSNNQYYKEIPEAVRRAVAAQVEFMIEQGDAFFKSLRGEMKAERIGDYNYERGSVAYQDSLIAPKARTLLRGIRNRKGAIIS